VPPEAAATISAHAAICTSRPASISTGLERMIPFSCLPRQVREFTVKQVDNATIYECINAAYSSAKPREAVVARTASCPRP